MEKTIARSKVPTHDTELTLKAISDLQVTVAGIAFDVKDLLSKFPSKVPINPVENPNA